MFGLRNVNNLYREIKKKKTQQPRNPYSPDRGMYRYSRMI